MYLEHKTCTNIAKHDVYAKFRDVFAIRSYEDQSKRDRTQELLDELLIFADAMQQYEACSASDRGTLQELVYATKVITKGAAYHFVIPAYYKYLKKELTEEHIVEMMRHIVSYLANLSIACLQFSGSNKGFSSLNSCLNAENPLLAFRVGFYKAFARYYPSEKALKKGLSTKCTLSNEAKLYLLKEIENFEHTEKLNSSWLKVVPIIPTKKEPNGNAYKESIESWHKARGSDYSKKAIASSLANFTLVKADDKEVEDWSSFEVKQEHMKLCAHNRLNKTISSAEVWTNAVIEERINLMYEAVLKLWPKPDLSDLNIDAATLTISEKEQNNKECFAQALSQCKAASELYSALDEAIHKKFPENVLSTLYKAKNKVVFADSGRPLISFTVNKYTTSVRLHCVLSELEKLESFAKLKAAQGLTFVAKVLKNDTFADAAFKNSLPTVKEQDLIVEVIIEWLKSQLSFE